MRAFFLFAFLLFTQQAAALSLDGYRTFVKQESESTGVEKVVAKIALSSYFSGVAESYGFLLYNRESAKEVFSTYDICIPPSVKITSKLFRLATDAGVESVDPNHSNTVVVAYTLLGLAQLFPCSTK
jgi:hypothetical protein